jgi:inorganic pyrophosphatase
LEFQGRWSEEASLLMADEVIEVVVEMPRGSRNKHETDHRTHRVLHSSVHYRTDCGFVPETLGEDGGPLDALVIVEEGSFPDCSVLGRPIGLLHKSGEPGTDITLLCVAATDLRFDTVTQLEDLAPHRLRGIEVFFETCKQLEDAKEVAVDGWERRAAAVAAGEAWRGRAPAGWGD